MSGKVYLVGAGPGDGGLITVKGRDLIRSADVVVYDRLIGREIMELIPERAERIDVGKNAGDHPVPQHEINKILSAQAKAGKTVVRLKGGDPFVFGRGGEELELLAEEGIEFEEVPGITSSIAAPAYAGIPVTHRDYCSSLHIITGHARAGRELQIDFEALVKLKGTLIFMMGVSTAGQIAEGLLKAGMDPQTPCAVIEKGTLPQQRRFVSPLSEIEETIRENDVHSPAVIMTGKVCALSDQFDWFSRRPLKGRKILVTQPEKRASRMADGLRALGADAVLYPCIRTAPIRPLEMPEREGDGDMLLHPADGYDILVFTSGEGVKSYCGWILEKELDMRILAGVKIAAIGSATAKALTEYGLRADFIPSVYSGRRLGEEMIESGFADTGSRVLLLRTDAASKDVVEVLREHGVQYRDVPVYTTELVSQLPLEDIETFDFVTFTSRSCVTGFVQSQAGSESRVGSESQAGPESRVDPAFGGGRRDFTGVKALCIGEQTAAAAREHGFEVTLSDEATIDSMLAKAGEI